MARPFRGSSGFTLVELLVVISIIGVLMLLLISGAQRSLEAARRMRCKNNLYQIGRGALLHLQKHGYYPSSGWGYKWTGDPDRGFGAKQPGGWIYDLLPYIEMENLHELGKGLGESEKRRALAEQKATPVALFICPSRRRAIAYPAKETSYNADQPSVLAKSDYAANGGTVRILGSGPRQMSCLQTYPDCQWNHSDEWLAERFDGLSSERSEVREAHVSRDGTSNTYFAGEKYLNPNKYYTGDDGADNNSMYQGNDWDVNRWANVDLVPRRDTPGYDTMSSRFGSAHSTGFHMVMCDGSVHQITYTIDPKIHELLANRRDGQPIPADAW